MKKKFITIDDVQYELHPIIRPKFKAHPLDVITLIDQNGNDQHALIHEISHETKYDGAICVKITLSYYDKS